MSVLSGPEIARLFNSRGSGGVPLLDIDPWNDKRLGPNSYDVALGDTLRCYRRGLAMRGGLSTRKENIADAIPIPSTGIRLEPGRLYLGHTVEAVHCEGLVPYIDGRSSMGRLGLSVHVTAGRGDDGFCGQFTLEITVVEPLTVFAGDLVGQLTFHTLVGERQPYRGRYQGQQGPTASRAHLPDERNPTTEA